MDKLEKALLEQMDGKKQTQLCPVCKTKTEFVCHKNGTANCTVCNSVGKVDLTNVIKDLKKMGVFVSSN